MNTINYNHMIFINNTKRMYLINSHSPATLAFLKKGVKKNANAMMDNP